MHEQYSAPELKLVGNANDVVLGSLGVGIDIQGEVLVVDMEFATDWGCSITH